MPIWRAVGGSPQSVAATGAAGLPIAIAIIGGRPAQFQPIVELYREAGRRAGHDPSDLRVSINSHGFVAETEEVAPLDRVGDGAFLDLGRSGVPLLGDGARDVGIDAEGEKRLRHRGGAVGSPCGRVCVSVVVVGGGVSIVALGTFLRGACPAAFSVAVAVAPSTATTASGTTGAAGSRRTRIFAVRFGVRSLPPLLLGVVRLRVLARASLSIATGAVLGVASGARIGGGGVSGRRVFGIAPGRVLSRLGSRFFGSVCVGGEIEGVERRRQGAGRRTEPHPDDEASVRVAGGAGRLAGVGRLGGADAR